MNKQKIKWTKKKIKCVECGKKERTFLTKKEYKHMKKTGFLPQLCCECLAKRYR